MEVLQSLGVNGTILPQFFIFLIAFVAMMEIAFKPFAAAHEERERNTKGSLENVTKLQSEIENLTTQYENEARAITSEIKNIFDKQREAAKLEADTFVSAAKMEAATLLKTTQAKVETQVREASTKAKEEIPSIAQSLVTKLLA